MPGVDADHVGVLVIAEVAQLLGLLGPWVPDDRVWQVVFLYPHLPPGHHVGHNVLMGQWGVDVNPVSPLVESDHLPALLVGRGLGRGRAGRSLGARACPVQEGDPVEPRHLTPPHVRALEVRVEHHVEVKAALLAGVVHPDIQVELLLPEDDPVGDLEVMLPHAVGEVTVSEREYCLDVSTGQTLRALLQLPLADAGKAVVGRPVHPIVPLSKLREHEGNSAPNWLPTVKHRFLADK